MRNLIAALLLFSSGYAYAVEPPTVLCGDCTSLRQFGNFGAAQIWRTTGGLGPEVGADKVWVDNPNTGQRAFVDVDRPFGSESFLGVPIPIPDYTKQEVNATWADGSAQEIWFLPNEVIGAIDEALEVEEQAHPGVPLTSIPEFDNLPGFNFTPWQLINPNTLINANWVFSVSTLNGSLPRGIVTVVECAWHSGC